MVAKPLCPLYKNIIKPLDRARYPELRYSPFCKSVDMWGRRQLGDGTAVGADSLYGVVIAHDIQDVWFFACILGEER